MKPTYLSGVIECEDLLNNGYTLRELREFIEFEATVLDYRWNDWVLGFTEGIEYFEKMMEEGVLKVCVVNK